MEFVRIARLSGQQLTVPRKFLRQLNPAEKPGKKTKHFAVFQIGEVLLAAPFDESESVSGVEEKVKKLIGFCSKGAGGDGGEGQGC